MRCRSPAATCSPPRWTSIPPRMRSSTRSTTASTCRPFLKVPGVISALRFKRRPLEMIIGGERKKIVIEGEPTYTALYELENPSVLVSPEFAKAVELGRWPGEVRPFTKNRKHFMWEKI